MDRKVRTVIINVAVYVGLILTINVFSGFVLDNKVALYKRFFPETRPELPVYADRARAYTIFDEFRSLGSEYVPYYAWSRKPFQGRETNIKANGDRAHTPTTDRPRGVVHFFGDSTVWGTGVGDNETIPAFFTRLEPDLLVLNHGESNFVSRQSLARLINLANQGNQGNQVDIAVFYSGINDTINLCRQDVSINGHTHASQIRNLLDRSHVLATFFGNTIDLITNLYNIRFAKQGGPSRCSHDPVYAERVADTLIANWTISRDVTTGHGGVFLAVLQPVAFYGSPKVDYLELEETIGRDLLAVYPILQRKIRELGHTWMVDLSHAFDGDVGYYLDYGHVIAAGNRLIADRIHGLLKQDLARRFGSKL